MKKVMMMAVFGLVIGITAHAQKAAIITSNKPGWHKIGETTVGFKNDRDVLYVIGADNFKAILLHVVDAPIHLEDLEVYFDNDEKQDVQVREDFLKGSETRVIDLNGGSRKIKKVVFKYRTVPNWHGDKADVVLYGYK